MPAYVSPKFDGKTSASDSGESCEDTADEDYLKLRPDAVSDRTVRLNCLGIVYERARNQENGMGQDAFSEMFGYIHREIIRGLPSIGQACAKEERTVADAGGAAFVDPAEGKFHRLRGNRPDRATGVMPCAIVSFTPDSLIGAGDLYVWILLKGCNEHLQKTGFPPVVIFEQGRIGRGAWLKGLIEVSGGAAVAEWKRQTDARVSKPFDEFAWSVIAGVVVEDLGDPVCPCLPEQTAKGAFEEDRSSIGDDAYANGAGRTRSHRGRKSALK